MLRRASRKPLALLGGKPVIQRVYEQVAGVLDDVVVATDDERIYDAVRAFGGKVEMTSTEHRSGTDRCWEAYCKQGGVFDVVVNVQGDEPFIRPEQVAAVKGCFDDPTTDIATLVKPFVPADELEALENPNSPKVVLDAQSRALYFSRSVIPYLRGVPREVVVAAHVLQAYRSVCVSQRGIAGCDGFAAIAARKGRIIGTTPMVGERLSHRCGGFGVRDCGHRYARGPRTGRAFFE